MIRVTALLPMKGHSERVPNKNMRLFDGRPLYHCVAQALEECRYVSSVVIDTDSEAIAADAAAHFSKAVIVPRPAVLCGDCVPMNDIIAHDLSLCEGEHFLQTHSTNPLLTVHSLEAAVERYFSALPGRDSLFSVTRLQTRLYWGSGEALNHDPAQLLRTQDLPPVFEENSNFYLFSKDSFAAAGRKRIGLAPEMFPMNKLDAVDIDEEEDFRLAELLHRVRREGGI